MAAEGTGCTDSTTTTTRRPGARLRALFVAVLVLAVCAFALGCEEEIDVNTPEGLEKALETGEKLDEAVKKIREMKPEEQADYGGKLQKHYLDGSSQDAEILSLLVRMKSADYKDAYLKALASEDQNDVLMGASVVGDLKMAEASDGLVNAFRATGDKDTQRAIFEAAARIKDKKLADLATETLSEKSPDDTHISVLRWACRALQIQKDPDSVKAALKGMFYVDQGGRSIATDCKLAVLGVGSAARTPVLEMLEGKNDEINRHVERYSDVFTKETITLNAVTILSKLEATESVPAILATVTDPAAIAPPSVLAAKPKNDPAWGEWGGLIGQVMQEAILALNDIGVAGNEEAKTALTVIYMWGEPYPTKLKPVIKNTGATMIEISMRVNAARVLAESGFLDADDALIQEMLAALKDESFSTGVRPDARSRIVADLATYFAVAARPGWTDSTWKFFNEMSANELDEKKYKLNFDFSQTRIRIADVKGAYELADQCADKGVECFAKVFDDEEPERYKSLKAIYEMGRSGKSEYFDVILGRFDRVDQALGYLYAVAALIRLGDATKVDAVQAKIDEHDGKMDAQKFKFMKDTLLVVKAALQAKTAG